MVIWLIGISGSGKTTLGNRLKEYYNNKKTKSFILDGDLVREFYENDLGYSKVDRIGNIKRIMLSAYVLEKNDIIPMIAHPERNRDILADYNKIKPLIRLNCLFQVTAASVCGDFGEGCLVIANKLLEQNLVTILATDAHSVKRRPPKLRQGREAAAKIVGEEVANRLVLGNPLVIAQSKFADL